MKSERKVHVLANRPMIIKIMSNIAMRLRASWGLLELKKKIIIPDRNMATVNPPVHISRLRRFILKNQWNVLQNLFILKLFMIIPFKDSQTYQSPVFYRRQHTTTRS